MLEYWCRWHRVGITQAHNAYLLLVASPQLCKTCLDSSVFAGHWFRNGLVINVLNGQWDGGRLGECSMPCAGPTETISPQWAGFVSAWDTAPPSASWVWQNIQMDSRCHSWASPAAALPLNDLLHEINVIIPYVPCSLGSCNCNSKYWFLSAYWYASIGLLSYISREKISLSL